jgi:DNA helicase-2/ATP-dependent DNA helicase PcrA
MAQEYILHRAHGMRQLRIDYRRELNEQQFAAVTAGDGPVLVIAGAGSGKTRTLVYRLAWLVEQGVAPGRILLLTFTNRAAKEMISRAQRVIEPDITSLWSGTFHHLCNRLLRRHAELAGYKSDFTILDREDAEDMLDECVKQAGIDTRQERFPKGNVLAEIYSLAANTQRSIEDVLAKEYDYFSRLAGQVKTLRDLYTERKRKTNAMDYDDLLVNCLRLFQAHPEVRDRYQEQFLHVLVDEYQDTNKIQADLVDALAARHRNVMVVGDDAQSIYSWRGASFENILRFADRYPGARTFKIEVNYRSLPAILSLANDAIRPNKHQHEKTLAPVRTGGGKPWLVQCGDANQQAEFVAQRMLELRDEGVSLSEMAVLYRAHFHSMELQMELTRRNIPFVITSGLRFFEQAHIKDVSCFLRAALNPQDELSFKRIARLMTGVGGKTADKLWKEIGAPGHRPLPASHRWIPKKAGEDWRQVAGVLNDLHAMKPKAASDMIERVLEKFYAGYLKAKYPNARAREEDLHQLAGFATQFESPEDFLSQLALLTNLEAEDATLATNSGQEYARLSTVHQAKGLEWKVVFVIGLCDGMFPLARSLELPEDEEEERRLFYVAVTRAKDELYLTYPVFRAIGGDTGGFQRVSRFVNDVPKTRYQELSLRYPSRDW